MHRAIWTSTADLDVPAGWQLPGFMDYVDAGRANYRQEGTA